MRLDPRHNHDGHMEELWESLQMAGLAVMSVGLWTMRVALTARGRRLAGSITAGIEALVFLVAFSSVMSEMDEIGRVAGYAGGVGLGTLLGVWLDERLSAGQSELRIVTEGHDLSLVQTLHDQGWPVTWTHGQGPLGPVTVGFVAVDDTKLRRLTAQLEKDVPDAFWTVERLKTARAVKRHQDWIQIRQPLRTRREDFSSPFLSRGSRKAGVLTHRRPRAGDVR